MSSRAFCPELPRRRFTVDDVLAMARLGLFEAGPRVELIEGELIEMSPHDPRHSRAIRVLTAVLQRAYDQGFLLLVQLPLQASATSLPEPDLAVVRGAERDFEGRHPRGDEAVLVVEVSWSSTDRDRGKAALYAQASVPVYWRLDLVARVLEVSEMPRPDGTYDTTRVIDEHGVATLPHSTHTVRIADLLPPA